MECGCNKTVWVGRALSALAVVPFLFGISMAFSHNPQVVQGMEHFGWQESKIMTIAILEVICVVLYLIPPFSVFGALLLTGYLGGAVATHLRIGESPALPIVVGVVAWLGLFLREGRLRELLPVRAKDFRYEREVTINRPQHEVFAYLKPLKNFQHWNPFIKKDAQVKSEYRGTDGQVGFVGAWDGNRNVGSGEQEITKIVEGQRIEFELRFMKPFKATNQGYFATEAVGGSQTRVRWGMSGKACFPMNIFGMFIDCEKMCGKEFESGLSQLKSLLEK